MCSLARCREFRILASKSKYLGTRRALSTRQLLSCFFFSRKEEKKRKGTLYELLKTIICIDTSIKVDLLPLGCNFKIYLFCDANCDAVFVYLFLELWITRKVPVLIFKKVEIQPQGCNFNFIHINFND